MVHLMRPLLDAQPCRSVLDLTPEMSAMHHSTLRTNALSSLAGAPPPQTNTQCDEIQENCKEAFDMLSQPPLEDYQL
eukprot:6487694-Amphidinium_carterae.1